MEVSYNVKGPLDGGLGGAPTGNSEHRGDDSAPPSPGNRDEEVKRRISLEKLPSWGDVDRLTETYFASVSPVRFS